MLWVLTLYSRPNIVSTLLEDTNLKVGQAGTCICLNIHVKYTQYSEASLLQDVYKVRFRID